MSWSVDRTGTKAAVRTAVDADLTKSAGYYAGKEEEKDVLSVRERVLAAIDAMPTDGINGMRVQASGSRSDGYLSVQVSVTRVSIELDAPAPAPATPAT